MLNSRAGHLELGVQHGGPPVGNDKKFRDFLEDLIKEINVIALDESISDESSFDRGYRGGMRAILAAIKYKIDLFELEDSGLRAKLIDVDEWFRLGRNYRPGM